MAFPSTSHWSGFRADNRVRYCITFRAFTLVELLVAIAIVAVLLGLLIPSLSRARFTARETTGLSTMRQLSQRVFQFADTNSDLMPRIDPEAFYPIGNGATIQYPYWQVHETWILTLHADFPVWEHADEIFCPGSRFRPAGLPDRLTSYAFSWSFAASPSYWRVANPEFEAVNRPVRLSDVRYPSNKAMLWDVDAGYYQRPLRFVGLDIADRVGVSMSDGSASSRRPTEARDAVENQFWLGPDIMKLRNTLDGVHGTDY